MDILQIKIYLAQFHNIKIKNFLFIFLSKGKKGHGSIIIPKGKFYYSLDNSAEINIDAGCLTLNEKMSSPDLSVGILKMKKNTSINVAKGFSIFSGHHIILMENAKLNLGSGYINYNVKIRCFKEISIGNNVAISENVTMWDTDVHSMVGN